MAPVSPILDLSSPARALLQGVAETLHPTRTLPHLLNQRQSQTNPDGGTVTVVAGDGDNDDPDSASTLSGGAIAGIVIGSIAGLLLLIWIIRSCTNLGAPPGDEAVPGRPWYGGVFGRHRRPRGRSPGPGGYYAYGYGERGGGGYDDDYDYGYERRGRRPRSRSGNRHYRHRVVQAVPVQEVRPVVVRGGSRRRSRR
ncbi:hypothetical protein VTH82DRAFT_1666 [Thermothelomyces myriococcoides]